VPDITLVMVPPHLKQDIQSSSISLIWKT